MTNFNKTATMSTYPAITPTSMANLPWPISPKQQHQRKPQLDGWVYESNSNMAV